MSFRKLFPGAILVLGLVAAGLHTMPSKAQQTPVKQDPQSAQRPRGPGQELAYETREAAGEEADETAQFKQSTSVAFIARHTGLSLPNAYFFSVLLNFVVVALVVIWAARKCLPGMFMSRTAGIQKAILEAKKSSEEARNRLAEVEQRLMRLDGEIARMRDAADKEAAAEEIRIQASVAEEAARIVEGARQEIASAAKSARRQLTAYAAELAVGLAQKQIHIDPSSDRTLVHNFAEGLSESGHSSPTGKDSH
ncbi:MAG TPA: ATP synthase F0 subunit B [Candidatus Acidoferrum sp.]|nr:ATP synthase F0 subunit B [Candidatus Acidoferrum sp.]